MRKRPARKKAAKRRPAKKKVTKRKPTRKKTVKKKTARRKPTRKKAKRKATKRKPGRKKAKTKRNPVKRRVKRKTPKKTAKRKVKKKAVKKKGTRAKNRAEKKAIKRKLRKELEKSVIQQQTFIEEEKKRNVKKYPVLPLGKSRRVDLVKSVLKQLVKNKKISDWRINLGSVRKANLYVGRDFKIENELTAIRKDVSVTIYTREEDGRMGEGTVPITETNARDIRQRILSTIEVCRHAKKQPFNLPAPEGEIEMPECHDEEMLQRFLDNKGREVPQELYEQVVETLDKIEDVTTNCFEILCSASTGRILNSNGLDISFHKTFIYFELTLSTEGKNGEQEFTYRAKAVSPEQLNLPLVLPEQAGIVRDVANAERNEGFDGDVLLSGQSLLDFFVPDQSVNPLLLHTFARLKIMGMNRFELDSPIGSFEGEPFSISTNPHLPKGVHTMPVDDDGTPLRPVELIRNGILVNHIAPARDSQYLGVPITGTLTNVHVGDGATREEHLRGQNYVEIASFSWFLPDPYSGDFSAEIRLGYKWLRGKKTPFRGGHLTGNVFDQVLDSRFSREVIHAGSYYGPRAILFKNAKIVKPN